MLGRIGKYELRSKLGRGGFGLVYRAFDPTVSREVAIKVLVGDGEPGADMLGRFRAEAAMTGKLKHNNIVTVFDYDVHEGHPYLVMELLDGETLEQFLRKKTPAVMVDKVRIMKQVAEGLRYAHQKGIAHRDMKPANIMILPDGTVKIMDFGIACVTTQDGTRRTREGEIAGTVAYMAPEQFQGKEGGVLSDIFAFGVMFYELIALNHPFKDRTTSQSDIGPLIYRITSMEPVPLRQLYPPCPEFLESMIQRAMEKDPALRAQSMEEILFDTAPVLFELQQRQASVIMSEVHSLVEIGDLASAQLKIRQVLDVDPAHMQAQRVWRQIQQEIQRQALQARIQLLTNEAEQCVEHRQYQKATELLDAARKLDPGDQTVGRRLAEVNTLLDGSRLAAKLLDQAKQEFRQGKLNDSYATVLQAAKADPGSPEVASLRERFAKELGDRERKGRLDAALRKIADFRNRADYAAALSLFDETEREHYGAPELVGLRLALEREQAGDIRRRREQTLKSGLRAAREAIDSGDPQKAKGMIEALRSDFPGEKAVESLFSEVEERIAAQVRAEAIGKIGQEVRSFLSARQFAECRTLLDDGLRQYPNDGELVRLRETTLARQIAYERSEALRQASEKAESLRAKGEIDSALEIATGALRELGDDPALLSLQRQIESELAQRRRTEVLAKTVAEARSLLDRSEPAKAVALLEKVQPSYPDEPQIAAILKDARQAQLALERLQYVRRILSEAAERELTQDWAGALQIIKRGLKGYPDQPELMSAAGRLSDALNAQERERAIIQAKGDIQAALARADWPLTQQLASTALAQFPEVSFFRQVGDEADQELRNAEKERLIAKVRGYLTREEFAEARRALPDSPPDSDLRWQALRGELALRENYRSVLDEAAGLHRLGQHIQAEKLLSDEIAKNPPDDRAAELLSTIAAERERLERDAAIQRAIGDADGLLQARDYEGAVVKLDSVIRQFGADPRLQRPRQFAIECLEISQRERLRNQTVSQALERADALERAGKPVSGLLEIEAALLRYPDQSQLTEVAKRLRQLIQRQEAERKIADHSAAIERALEAGNWRQAGLSLGAAELEFPGDPAWTKPKKTVAEQRRAAELDLLQNQVRQCLERGDFDAAERHLAASRTAYSTEPRWQALQEEVDRLRAYENALREADDARKRQNYDAAERQLNAIAARAPDGRAAQFLKELDDLRTRAQSEFQSTLEKIGKLLDRGDFASAARLLEAAAAEHPTDPAVLALAAKAGAHKQQQEREIRLRDALGRSAELERGGKFSEALTALESLKLEFPTNAEIDASIQRVRSRMVLSDAVRAVEERLSGHDWDNALTIIDKAERDYPTEAVFGRLRQRALDGRRQEDLQVQAEAIRNRIANGDLNGAQDLLAKALQSFGREQMLGALQGALDVAKERRVKLASAASLLNSRKYPEAEKELSRLLKDNPSDPDAWRLLETLKEHQRRERQKQKYEAGLAAARKLLQDRQWDAAILAYQSLIAQFPGDATLDQELREASEAKQKALRREKYQQIRSEAELLTQNRQFDAALLKLDALIKEYPHDATLAEDASAVRDLRRQLERKEAYQKGRTQADQLLADRKFDAAIQHLRKLLQQFPADVLIEEAIQAAETAKRVFEQREAYMEAREQAARLLRGRKFDQAIVALEKQLTEFPKDPALEEELRTAREARNLHAQRLAVNERVAELDKLYRNGDFRAVQEKAAALLAEHEEPRARELLDWARTAAKRPPQPPGSRKRLAVASAVVLAGLAGMGFWIMGPKTTELRVTPERLSFSYREGGEPQPQTLKIQGAGGTLDWILSITGDWMSVSPDRGRTPGAVSVKVDKAPTLKPGNYDGFLAFSTPGQVTRPKNVQVNVTVIGNVAKPSSPPEPRPRVIPEPKPNPKSPRAEVLDKPDPKPVEPPKVQPKAPPAVDCHAPTYTGLDRGTISWIGELGPNLTLTFGRTRTMGIKGDLLPGCDVEIINISQGVALEEKPSPANGYSVARVRNTSNGVINSVKMTWKAK